MITRLIAVVAILGLTWGLTWLGLTYGSGDGLPDQQLMDRMRVLTIGSLLEAEAAESNQSAAALFAADPVGYWPESDHLDLVVKDLKSGGFLVGTSGPDGELQTKDDVFYYFPNEGAGV